MIQLYKFFFIMVLFLKRSSSHIIWLRYLPWLFDNSWIIYKDHRVPDKPQSVFLQPTFAIPCAHPPGVAHVSGGELFTFPWVPCLLHFMFFPFPEPLASRHMPPPPPLDFKTKVPVDVTSPCLESPHALWVPLYACTFCHILSHCQVSGEMVC